MWIGSFFVCAFVSSVSSIFHKWFSFFNSFETWPIYFWGSGTISTHICVYFQLKPSQLKTKRLAKHFEYVCYTNTRMNVFLCVSARVCVVCGVSVRISLFEPVVSFRAIYELDTKIGIYTKENGEEEKTERVREKNAKPTNFKRLFVLIVTHLFYTNRSFA